MLATSTESFTDPRLVDEVIARARKHPGGIDFLLDGYLGCVAISLGAHAFTVEAARARLMAGEGARPKAAFAS